MVQNPLAHTDSDARGQSVLVSSSFSHPFRYSKPIARPFQNGFLQVAVSKTLRHPAFTAPEPFICWSASDTALELVRTNPNRRTRIPVAVGMTIADRPPHRSVRARLLVRLLRRMSSVEASIRIGVQNAGWRNPPVQDWGKTFPPHLGALSFVGQLSIITSSTSERRSSSSDCVDRIMAAFAFLQVLSASTTYL